jgi:hypothetical protein
VERDRALRPHLRIAWRMLLIPAPCWLLSWRLVNTPKSDAQHAIRKDVHRMLFG